MRTLHGQVSASVPSVLERLELGLDHDGIDDHLTSSVISILLMIPSSGFQLRSKICGSYWQLI